MNVLGLIFSLLMILSYTFCASWDKHSLSRRLELSYIGHQRANRKILNQYQSAVYKEIRSMPSEPSESDKKKEPNTCPPPKKIEPNRTCAKINLWPLIQQSSTNQHLFKSIVLKFLSTYYRNSLLSEAKISEEQLLKAIIASAKEIQGAAPLEKLDLKNPHLQKSYYKMLKGTKNWHSTEKKGYPSLLDYFKIEPAEEERICLFHAHPDLLKAIFNPKMGETLYNEIHEKKSPLTKELLERVCSESQLIGFNEEFVHLFQIGQPEHAELKKTFFAQDSKTNISLRKSLFMGKSS